MKREVILIIEPEHRETTSLKSIFERKEITQSYDVEFIDPDFNLENQAFIQRIIEKAVRVIKRRTIKAVLVDVRILENKVGDTSGLDIATNIKMSFPELPVINITNYYDGDDIFLFGKSSLAFTDGILPKRLLYEDSFSKNEFEKIIARAKEKIQNIKAVYSQSKETTSIAFPSKNISKKIDIAVITALKDPEFSSFEYFFKSIKKLPEEDLLFPDNSHYYFTELNKSGKKIGIVAATDDCMGMTATCSLATRMIRQFNPTYIVLLGICAGIKGKAAIGDIIIATYCWDYGSGKFETDRKSRARLFRPSPEQEKLDTKLKKTIADFITEKILSDIKSENKSAYITDTPIEAHLKPFASGSAVISNTEVVDEIKSQHRKLIGFDMEAYGLFYAGSNTNDSNVKSISIKAVSDFGTEEKNTKMKKQHQLYAARNSALFFKKFCLDVLMK